MKDLSTDEETCIAEGWYASSYPFEHESFVDPHVADGVVVFTSQKYVFDSETSQFHYEVDIMLYDIESEQTTQLNTVSELWRWHPVVSDGWVTWTDRRNDNEMEVWGYDLVAEEEVQLVAHDPSDSETGWFKYAGRSTTGSGWVIWSDHRPDDGDDDNSDLYAKYLGAGPAPTQVMPLQGADRYTTAIEISREAFPEGADALVIATGRNWPDALAGSALAGAWGAPILLADSAMQDGGEWLLPEAIAGEIERLSPSTVFILGGESAVPAPVQDAIDALLGEADVRRLGGIDRFETACIVASETVDALGDEWDGNAFVTTGSNFPDALAASPLAANVGYPLFLSGPAGLSEDTQACMDDLNVDGAIVLGGSVAVPLSVLGQMQALGVTELDRVGGADRYQTATRIAEYGVDEFGMSMDTLGIATGANYPDALAMGGALGQSGYVMMLTSPTYLPAATTLALEEHADDISQVRYAGGTGAITQTVRNAIAALIH
jgi:putative cell wall-binding protein